MTPPLVIVAGLLTISNVIMAYAWYGHLKDRQGPLWSAIAISWAIALFEYMFAVPANRIGAQTMSLAQLKTIQEVVTLAVFVPFAWILFGEAPTLSTLLGFALIAAGAALVFLRPLG